jgi:hypothetical protein
MMLGHSVVPAAEFAFTRYKELEMFSKKASYIFPVMLTSVFFLTGCDNKPQSDEVVIEENIVMNDGALVKDWIVEEIIPVPARKPAGLAGPRPSKDYIWIPGEWKRENDEWVWESGRWMKPPHQHASWMEGHWRLETGKWHWAPAHWVLSNHPQHVSEPLVVPALLPEVIPAKPADQNHWIAGYWDWDGHWYWVNGYWTNKPHTDAEWIPGHWDEFGAAGGYRWIGSHWRVKS